MKPASLLALLLPVLIASTASADDAACLSAASKAQKLRAAHQLVEAREQLRVCASSACPGVVQNDCVTWLADVEKALPGVVVVAKSPAGVDLVDVKVTVDGQPFASRLDGQAVAMNAGAHTFHFEAKDGTSLDRQVLVREGEKSQEVVVTLGAPASPGPAPEESTPASPLRTTGWVLAGVGVAGIVVGAVAGGIAMSDKSSAHCTNNVCDPGTVGGIKSAALASTVGFAAGGVLLATGGGLLLFAPKPRADAPPRAGALRLTPVFGVTGAELVATGSFQ